LSILSSRRVAWQGSTGSVVADLHTKELIDDWHSTEYRSLGPAYSRRAGNLRELIEQAAAYSGAADDDLASRRIAEQEALLARLVNERDMELVQMEPSWNSTARIK
jgi:hypothetical protein